MGQWNVRLLGTFSATREGEVVTRFRTRATDSVFAYLALHVGRPISRDSLISLIWPDAPEESGKQNLRAALTSIRKSLGEECLVADRRDVTLLESQIATDIARFRRSQNPADYGGRFLDGMADEWMAMPAIQLEEEYVAAVIGLMASLPTEQAIVIANEALARDPSRLDIRAKLNELTPAQMTGTPYIATPFIGREAEIASLNERMKEHRQITLSGPGGCGKTRIAAELWKRHRPRSWFVGLADLSDAAAVPEAIRLALKLPDSSNRRPIEQVIFSIGDSEGLLIIDNFEHLIEGVGCIAELLAGCERLRVIITSQTLLGLPGELDYPVGPMEIGYGESGELPDSARLFVSRARSVCPSFVINEGNKDAVVELCCQLDGYPLALEIAAAKVRLMSPKEMLSQLSDRFAFLTRRDGLPSRHRSLRAALDWSFERLSPAEQDLLSDLTVFRGGFTLEAAREVVDREGCDWALEALVANSWVDNNACQEPIRFRLLESVREFATEFLPPRRLEELRARHAALYLRIALHREEVSFTAEETSAHERMEPDYHNLETAWAWLIEKDVDRALAFAGSMSWFWIIRGQLQLGESRLRLALDRTTTASSPLRAHAIRCVGDSQIFQGRFVEAEIVAREGLKMALETKDDLVIGLAYNLMGFIDAELGRYKSAIANVESSFPHLIDQSNPNWLGISYTIGCLACNRAGDHQRGIEMGKACVERYRFGGYHWGIASGLNELAMAYHLAGDFPNSIATQEESIALKREAKAPRSLALSLSDLAWTLTATGDFRRARPVIAESFAILKTLEEPLAFPHLYVSAAETLAAEGTLEPARQALHIFSSTLTDKAPLHAHLQEAQARAKALGMTLPESTTRAKPDAVIDQFRTRVTIL